MKACKVLEKLNVTRKTLNSYVKSGKIRVKELGNGFYDYDEELDAYVCQVNLDEDEMISFVSGQTGRCPYYRYYDEYKSVHKQI